MSPLIVYSRQGCHLCEVMIEELLPITRGQIEVEVRDIDSREDWRERYDVRVPVLAYEDEEICHYQLDRSALAELLKRLESAA
ncbi:MAG: glutaredoxin family protein [Woeseiaceae bacterium]|nr:glutaredoxin family protein [Woeseiaceae bacterium]